MAGKSKTVYICTECGHESAKWYGKCPGCAAWNTMQEEMKSASVSKKTSVSFQAQPAAKLHEIGAGTEVRYATGMKELDRVLGGGVVKGSLVIIGGDPGIGKSTILLQICQPMGEGGRRILYVSGEESAAQIKLRANRLGVTTDNLSLYPQTDIMMILEYIKQEKPDVVIIDSIQTMNLTELSSSPGSVAQVRECTSLLMHTAKNLAIPILIVGHVNKDGAIAGPKVMEHIVDTVLYFEGERHQSYRILRGVKNRFGSTNEIGVFEMGDAGLMEVENPSQLMLAGRPTNVPGTCVACVMEGTRPILTEVQGLVTPTSFGIPRRMSTGFDYNRMSMLIAVLEKRAGYLFGNMDAYINVVGGLKLDEPAADLSVAMALVSSLKEEIIGEHVLAFGEIGLSGEVRAAGSCEKRIKEATRMGFAKCIIPFYNYKSLSAGLKREHDLVPVRTVREAFQALTE